MSEAEITAIEKVAAELAACYGEDWEEMDDYAKRFYLEPVQKLAAVEAGACKHCPRGLTCPCCPHEDATP